MEVIGFRENFRKSYEMFQYKPSHFLGIILLWIGLSMIPIVNYLASLLQPGIYVSYMKLMRREEVTIQDVFWSFQSFDKFLKVFATIIILFIALFFGMLFFIIPGIYLAVVIVPCYFIIVTENVEFLDVFNRCRQLINGHWWKTFRFLLLIGLFNILGVLCLIVGFIFTGAISTIMMINYFQNLNEYNLENRQELV